MPGATLGSVMIRRASSLAVLAMLFVLGGGLPRVLSPALRRAEADDTKDALKAFRSASRAKPWKDRRDAYLTIADFDGAEAARAVLDAAVREQNPAVVLTALNVLADFGSEGAQGALATALGKSKGTRKMYVLMALARQSGDKAVPLLLETLRGKGAPAIAQAALALGRREVQAAVPDFLRLLRHKDWQVRRAVAIGLRRIAQPPPPKPEKGKPADPQFRWPVPEALAAPEVTQALASALAASRGRERRDIIQALDAIHDKDLGDNVAAWKAVAEGREPDEKTLAQRVRPPYAFGVPIYGKRVVLIYDNSLRSGDPHKFGSDERLAEVCEVPGSRPLLQMRLRTVGQFVQAHYRRCIHDMAKGTKFELITFNETVRPTFGKFASASKTSRKAVDALFEGLQNDNGINTYGALTEALDMGGAAESKAWKRGPDEIVFMSCNIPTAGEIQEADVIGAAIALKGRMRMVPIHTVGVLSHAFNMMRTIAAETGGIYRNYDR